MIYSASLYYQSGILENEEELATHSRSQKGGLPVRGIAGAETLHYEGLSCWNIRKGRNVRGREVRQGQTMGRVGGPGGSQQGCYLWDFVVSFLEAMRLKTS